MHPLLQKKITKNVVENHVFIFVFEILIRKFYWVEERKEIKKKILSERKGLFMLT